MRGRKIARGSMATATSLSVPLGPSLRTFALDGELKIEKSLNNEILKKLKNIGHSISIVDDAIGGGQCIKIDRKNGILIGGSDPRKDGMAIGY